MKTTDTAILAKFWSRVDVKGVNDCWTWKAFRMKNGYGMFGREYAATHSQLAHRWAWEFVNGPIPKGLLVLHRCDNPGCVNPRHLFVGTQHDNLTDQGAKGRHHNQQKTHCPKGHEYTAANTKVIKRRDRGTYCRTCVTCLKEISDKANKKYLEKKRREAA